MNGIGFSLEAVMLHPAGFAVLDPGLMLAAPHEIAERVLSAIVATIGGKLYPARRERIARLREMLAEAPRRGHTLGGCRFVAWRERILVLRELAEAADPVRLIPGASCLWDRRFRLALPAAAGAVTVGYLGRSRRCRAEPSGAARCGTAACLGWSIQFCRQDGTRRASSAVPHLGYRRQAVAALPQVGFRPINPLSRAGFTVV